MGWTQEQVETVTRLWPTHSASYIGAQLGLTRNSIIGKAARLGLSKPRSKTVWSRATAPNAPKQSCPRGGRGRPKLSKFAGPWAQSPPGAAPTAPEPGSSETIVRRGVTLMELAHGDCRFPIGDPRAPGFCFCGNASFPGLSYCVGHARLAYRPANRRAA